MARLLPPENSAVEVVSYEIGVSVATPERWRVKALAQVSDLGGGQCWAPAGGSPRPARESRRRDRHAAVNAAMLHQNSHRVTTSLYARPSQAGKTRPLGDRGAITSVRHFFSSPPNASNAAFVPSHCCLLAAGTFSIRLQEIRFGKSANRFCFAGNQCRAEGQWYAGATVYTVIMPSNSITGLSAAERRTRRHSLGTGIGDGRYPRPVQRPTLLVGLPRYVGDHCSL
jgi:hypothetical protein